MADINCKVCTTIEPTTPPSERVRILNEYAAEGARNPHVQAIAQSLVRVLTARLGRTPTVAEIVQWFMDAIHLLVDYVPDPPGEEVFQPVWWTLAGGGGFETSELTGQTKGSGDCEDLAALLVALCLCVGIGARTRWWDQPGAALNHVAAETWLGNGWIPAETTIPGAYLGESPYQALARVGAGYRSRIFGLSDAAGGVFRPSGGIVTNLQALNRQGGATPPPATPNVSRPAFRALNLNVSPLEPTNPPPPVTPRPRLNLANFVAPTLNVMELPQAPTPETGGTVVVRGVPDLDDPTLDRLTDGSHYAASIVRLYKRGDWYGQNGEARDQARTVAVFHRAVFHRAVSPGGEQPFDPADIGPIDGMWRPDMEHPSLPRTPPPRTVTMVADNVPNGDYVLTVWVESAVGRQQPVRRLDRTLDVTVRDNGLTEVPYNAMLPVPDERSQRADAQASPIVPMVLSTVRVTGVPAPWVATMDGERPAIDNSATVGEVVFNVTPGPRVIVLTNPTLGTSLRFVPNIPASGTTLNYSYNTSRAEVFARGRRDGVTGITEDGRRIGYLADAAENLSILPPEIKRQFREFEDVNNGKTDAQGRGLYVLYLKGRGMILVPATGAEMARIVGDLMPFRRRINPDGFYAYELQAPDSAFAVV